MTLRGMAAAQQRSEWLRSELHANGSVNLESAAQALEVSAMTVRRDLLELEAAGVARRVRGGAVALGHATLAERQPRNAKAKARIVAKLLPLVPDSGVVAFDASSTVLRLAGALEGARDLLVLTNGLETFTALQGKRGIKPVLTGGEDATGSGSLVGPIAVRVTAAFHLTHFFCSAAGVDDSTGSSETSLEEGEVKREMGRVAGETILAVDASKLGLRSTTVCHLWEDVGIMVTDLNPDDPALELIPWQDDPALGLRNQVASERSAKGCRAQV